LGLNRIYEGIKSNLKLKNYLFSLKLLKRKQTYQSNKQKDTAPTTPCLRAL